MRLLLLCLLVLCVVWNVQTVPTRTVPTITLDTSKLDIPEPKTSPDVNNGQTELFEGDVILSTEQKEIFKSMIEEEKKVEKGEMTREKRKHFYPAQLWPRGIVPFESLDMGDFAKDQMAKDAINSAMRHLETQTCIKFSRVTSGDRVRFVNGSGCYTQLGKIINDDGVHIINLSNGWYQQGTCATMGIATHEILHALGFMHEQSRPDRDKYVTINEDAIEAGKKSQFVKYSYENSRLYDTPYDIGSLMHYGSKDFSKDGITRVIVPVDPSKESLMGQRDAMSRYDAQIVRAVYKCSGSGTGSTSGITHGTPCADNPYISPPCSELSMACHQLDVQQYCRKTCNKCKEETTTTTTTPTTTECKTTAAGTEYAGTTRVAYSGTTCLKWEGKWYSADGFPEDTLAKAENYCRNPDGDVQGPWCFIYGTEKIEYCTNIKLCG